MTVTTAVVLAGGEGRRLRPLTANRPKPMLRAGDRPILAHVFNSLIEAGITEIHVVIGYRGERVQNHFGSTHDGVDLEYHRQETQLGSGHALLQAAGAVDEPFIVANGDQLTEPSLVGDVAAAHEAGGATATVGVVRASDATRYGAVTLDGDEVVELVERPDDDEYHLLNAGVYAFGPAFFDVLDETPRQQGSISLPAAVERVVDDERAVVRGVRTEGFWTDATYPWDLLAASRNVLSRGWIAAPEPDPERWVAETARIHDDAVLRGPVVVGPDTVVGPGVVLGPYASVGRNVTVDANAVVRNTVVDDDARIGPNATLVDSVVGQGVRCAAGTVVAGGPADVRIGTTVHEEKQLGSVLADRATLGAGAVVSPGVLVGSDATVEEGVRLQTNVDANANVR